LQARLGFGIRDAGPVLASVGNLVELKGHHIVLEALSHLPRARLLIAGEGPERSSLERRAIQLGVADRTRFLGRVPQEELPKFYSAADVLVLASSREGWANVLLEAMACGTPVVATDISGMVEVVGAPSAGRLVRHRTATEFADTIAALLAAPPERSATRAYAEAFSWDATTEGQVALFKSLLAPALAPSLG
jgi:glycosyltransferase involved in cell wall biosynthesis